MDAASPADFEFDAGRLAGVLAEVRARRAAGETLTDEAVLNAYPALGPQLAVELRKLGMIERARRLAGSPSPSPTAAHPAAARLSAGLAPDSIAGYEILREIHRGSQGVVYHAIQKSTRREVAVKVLLQGPFADSDDRMRFDREVRVLSALKHPNIVSIHDSGEASGHSYFVMNYIEGEPLDSFVAHARCSIDTLLRLFVKICDAVSAAQICGVIHRDLKPGNIRIDRSGQPHVLDFGLARIDPDIAVRSAASEAGIDGSAPDDFVHQAANIFTETGQFVGSLPWASPEQAEGAGNVDVRTDVYSLGVVLYQALTGRFPYPVNGSLRTVLDHIQNAPPTPPSTLRRDINDEVETIVLKCLQKDRERRYQSAGELSHDVQRYLRGEPIDAKRDSRMYVLRKQLRRHRVPVFAALAVFVSLIAGIIGTSHATWRARRAEADALARARAESRLRERADWESYKACLAAADAALVANDTAAAQARLDAAPAGLRGWEWRYLHGRLDQSLASYTVDRPIVKRFALAPDGRTVFVAGTDGTLCVIDTHTGTTRQLSRLPGADVTTLALSRDGLRIALGLRSGEVCLCNTADGQALLRFRVHPTAPVSALAFSPNGALLASGTWLAGSDDPIRLWDVATGRAHGTLAKPDSWVNALAFRPDGRVLAAALTKASAGFRLWDVEDARELLAVNYEGLDATHVEFSPAGDRIAVASQDAALKVYDAASGREICTLAGHTASVNDVAFSSDGTRLASASADQTVRIWDLATGSEVSCRRGHMNGVNQVAFLTGRDELLSMSAFESTLKRWDVRAAEEPPTFDTGKYFVLFVTFSADGRRLFTHQRCWDTASGRMLARLPPRGGWDANGWIGPDESVEWATNGPPEASGELLRDGKSMLRTTEPLLFAPVISGDGRRFALGLQRGVLQAFGTDDGRLIRELAIDPELVTGDAFSHKGDEVVTWTSNGQWTIWDVVAGRPLITRRHGTDQIVNAAFSLDDRLLATASYDGAARICDAATGEELHVLRPTGVPAGDQSVVWSVAFSPDGTRLATGSKDRRIRLWDVATGQELIALTRHAGTVMCLAWSPDGTQLASGGFDGTVCLWDSLSRAKRGERVERTDDPHAAPLESSADGDSK